MKTFKYWDNSNMPKEKVLILEVESSDDAQLAEADKKFEEKMEYNPSKYPYIDVSIHKE